MKAKIIFEACFVLKPFMFCGWCCLFVCFSLIFFFWHITCSSLTNVCLANVIKVVNLYECISTMSMISLIFIVKM